MEQQRTPGWRQFGLTGWFSVILGVGAWWARHPRHTVDLSTRWGVGRIDLRAVLFGLVLAYLLMWAVYLVGQLILPTDHRQLLRQGLWGRPARWTRGVIVVAALFLGGLNTYTQAYHPLHYAQKAVTRDLRAQDAGQLRQLSWSPASYRRLRHATAVRLTREDAGSNHYLTYTGYLNDARHHRVAVTVARHRLDRLGLGMAYSVKTIEVN
ncbi:hypothetical protein [Levilactobacillus spicheri]|uniref:Uncharacterized protein n=1 Tax=Levilactobacillus spicheri TaxID=216463 RepID=A0A0F3RR46_9LACO|nr:hypothetical protein [Levilactobacillus spicheri]KJW12466.1 hypothetical protein VC81_08200 [Levilactobacillus spicheri]